MTPDGLTTALTDPEGVALVAAIHERVKMQAPVEEYVITIHGHPATQGSKKVFKRGKKIVLVEMDPKLPAWRAAVTMAAKQAARGEPWDCAVSVSGVVYLPKPRTTKFTDYPAGPPDADKLARAIGDALTNSQIITDDARIVHWDIRKAWATGKPGAQLHIQPLP